MVREVHILLGRLVVRVVEGTLRQSPSPLQQRPEVLRCSFCM